MNNFNDMWIAGLPAKELIENYNISKKDLMPYLPISSEELSSYKYSNSLLGILFEMGATRSILLCC